MPGTGWVLYKHFVGYSQQPCKVNAVNSSLPWSNWRLRDVYGFSSNRTCVFIPYSWLFQLFNNERLYPHLTFWFQNYRCEWQSYSLENLIFVSFPYPFYVTFTYFVFFFTYSACLFLNLHFFFKRQNTTPKIFFINTVLN